MQLTPSELVRFLVALYSLFDALVTKHGGYKMETVGKTYMAAFGLQVRLGIGQLATPSPPPLLLLLPLTVARLRPLTLHSKHV